MPIGHYPNPDGDECSSWMTIIAGLTIFAIVICILIWGYDPLGWFGQPLPTGK